MRVSLDEVLRVSQLVAESAREHTEGSAFREAESVVSALGSRDLQMVNEAITREPDVREQIVASLRERIEAGTYQVSGEQIAEMMVRRSRADRHR